MWTGAGLAENQERGCPRGPDIGQWAKKGDARFENDTAGRQKFGVLGRRAKKGDARFENDTAGRQKFGVSRRLGENRNPIPLESYQLRFSHGIWRRRFPSWFLHNSIFEIKKNLLHPLPVGKISTPRTLEIHSARENIYSTGRVISSTIPAMLKSPSRRLCLLQAPCATTFSVHARKTPKLLSP